jgi:uncharacterized protein (TIGR02145 family)
MQYSTTPGVKGICPTGWHLPTDAEWTTLTNFVNNQQSYQCNSTSGWIGKAMADSTKWTSSTTICAIGNNLSLNNATGFSCLPGGYRHFDGYFYSVKTNGNWWTSTEIDNDYAWFRHLFYDFREVYQYSYNKEYGFNVRCLQD